MACVVVSVFASLLPAAREADQRTMQCGGAPVMNAGVKMLASGWAAHTERKRSAGEADVCEMRDGNVLNE